MNLGISTTQSTTWKRIKTHHIATAAGLALAVSAVISGASILNETGSSPAPRASVPASLNSPARQPQTFIYIVTSQAEAAQLEQGFSTASLESGADVSHHVLVAEPENEAVMQGELMLAWNGANVTVVDLRGPAVPAIGGRADFSQVLTPEAEMLSTGMPLP